MKVLNHSLLRLQLPCRSSSGITQVPTASTRVRAQVVNRAALCRQICSEYFGFPCHSFILLIAVQLSPSIIQGRYTGSVFGRSNSRLGANSPQLINKNRMCWWREMTSCGTSHFLLHLLRFSAWQPSSCSEYVPVGDIMVCAISPCGGSQELSPYNWSETEENCLQEK
jgi:hypothetical protein